jgi:iron complex transport system ATP-binding protein
VVLDRIDWGVAAGERWIVLGPNGSGKTTLLQVAGGYLHPSSGSVEILGQRLGQVDVRRLRERVAVASPAVAKMLRPELSATDAVMTARHAAVEPWWHHYTVEDRAHARDLLAGAGLGHLADRPFGVLSEGERQHVVLARTLMGCPELLLFDEPAAGLDLGARERLLARIGELAADRDTPPMILVTHRVEEVPRSFTNALLLRHGRVVAAGPLPETLTSEHLSSCFGLPLEVSVALGRYAARASG